MSTTFPNRAGAPLQVNAMPSGNPVLPGVSVTEAVLPVVAPATTVMFAGTPGLLRLKSMTFTVMLVEAAAANTASPA